MKVSNETKIGALTIVAIVFLILGFNFLKGKSLFKTGYFLYAKFPQLNGLVGSNPVIINGFQAGTVSAINADKSLKEIVVEIKLFKNYDIPKGSVASISNNPLGSSSVVITLGKAAELLHSNDTLATAVSSGALSDAVNQIKPLVTETQSVMLRMDTLLGNINSVLDSSSRQNLRDVTVNLSSATAGLNQTLLLLNGALDPKTGVFSETIQNLNDFTKSLVDNNRNLDSIVANLKNTSEHLSKADIAGISDNLKKSTDHLNQLLATMQSPDKSSVGALMNSKEMYNELLHTVNSLHILLDDLRVHPKRYVNVSIFGKKDKGDYLQTPLAKGADTTQMQSPSTLQ